MVNRQMYVCATNRVEGQKGLTEFFAAEAFEPRGKETDSVWIQIRPLQVSIWCLQASVWHLMQNSPKLLL